METFSLNSENNETQTKNLKDMSASNVSGNTSAQQFKNNINPEMIFKDVAELE